MPLVILEKMVLTDGITFWGRNPATTITIAAANREYSMKSCPRWSFHSAAKTQQYTAHSVLRLEFHFEAEWGYLQLRKNRSWIGKRPYYFANSLGDSVRAKQRVAGLGN